MYNICVLGSSTLWTPELVTDLMCVFSEPLEVRFIDINPAAAQKCTEWGEAASKYYGRKDRFIPFTDRAKALEGADGVLITLSVGGLEAMAQDLAIPEKYGIFTTVGDSVGAAGWSRSIRNIPYFIEFAEDFQRICPNAFIANYSNSMSALTAALQLNCENPVAGFCHSYFATKDFIQKIFKLEDWSQISVSIAGMNHFSWVVDFKIGKEDGYKLLREKIGGGRLKDLVPKDKGEDRSFHAGFDLCLEFYDATGFITYPKDRHTSEFVSFVLGGFPERFTFTNSLGVQYDTVKYCGIKRTAISHRLTRNSEIEEKFSNMIEKMKNGAGEPVKSRETGADMIHAYLCNKPFCDAVNTLNIGQIPGLPPGACVETLGVVDGLGVHPLTVKKIPEHLLELMRPQVVCSKWIVEGVMKRDKELLLQALYRDPQCAHLKPHEIRSMARELFEANGKYIGHYF